MVVPLAAGVVALVGFAAVAGPGWLLLGGADAIEASNIALWLVLALASVVAAWASAGGQAVIMAAAAERMDGRDASLGAAVAVARSRAGRLLEWAVLATVVSIVLDQLEQRLGVVGRIISWVGGMAFSVLSFLALPVIVFEDVGAIEGFKRSSRLLRATWGEQLTFGFGLGILTLVAILPALPVAFFAAASGILLLQVVGIAVAVAWIVAVVSVTSALSAVFKTALYRHATGSPVDAAFGAGDLSGAFRRR